MEEERHDQGVAPAVGPPDGVLYLRPSESFPHLSLNNQGGGWASWESSSFPEPSESFYVTPSTLVLLEKSHLKCSSGSHYAKWPSQNVPETWYPNLLVNQTLAVWEALGMIGSGMSWKTKVSSPSLSPLPPSSLLSLVLFPFPPSPLFFPPPTHLITSYGLPLQAQLSSCLPYYQGPSDCPSAQTGAPAQRPGVKQRHGRPWIAATSSEGHDASCRRLPHLPRLPHPNHEISGHWRLFLCS